VEAKKLQYFENVNHPVQREFIQAQNHCVLCGTVLELNHTSNKDSKTIKEEAYCPQCTLKTRAKIYLLN
jgi:hypothetical protein